MANLGQAVDFVIQHLENPGWLGNVWVQFGTVIVGLLFIFWDRKRPNWLPSPELSPRQMIITGLVIILIGVITGSVLVGIGIWNQPPASMTVTSPQVQQEQSTAVQPVFTTEDISKMLAALAQMQIIVGDRVRNFSEATQYVSLDLLAKGGASALLGKLQPIRDGMRQANKDLNQLFFEYRYYDAELRPVLAGYASALGWEDNSLTPIIDDLNKYSGSPPDVLQALVRDRYVEWANDSAPHFGKWYGGAEARIAAETKRIREWPRISQPTEVRSFGFARAVPALAPEPLLPDDGGPIKWVHGAYFLSMSSSPTGMEIGGIQAVGTNESDEFIGPVSGFVRSESSGRQIAFLIDNDKGQNVPIDGYGIPARNQFHLFAPFGTPVKIDEFLRDFARLTFVFQYGTQVYTKHFAPDEMQKEVSRTEAFLAPKPQVNRVGARPMPKENQ